MFYIKLDFYNRIHTNRVKDLMTPRPCPNPNFFYCTVLRIYMVQLDNQIFKHNAKAGEQEYRWEDCQVMDDHISINSKLIFLDLEIFDMDSMIWI